MHIHRLVIAIGDHHPSFQVKCLKHQKSLCFFTRHPSDPPDPENVMTKSTLAGSCNRRLAKRRPAPQVAPSVRVTLVTWDSDTLARLAMVFRKALSASAFVKSSELAEISVQPSTVATATEAPSARVPRQVPAS